MAASGKETGVETAGGAARAAGPITMTGPAVMRDPTVANPFLQAAGCCSEHLACPIMRLCRSLSVLNNMNRPGRYALL